MAENQNQSQVEYRRANIQSFEKRAISSMETALCEIKSLSVARLKAKMSVSRLTGVARELRELIKVMSIYGCE